jgi:hypothetical protein
MHEVNSITVPVYQVAKPPALASWQTITIPIPIAAGACLSALAVMGAAMEAIILYRRRVFYGLTMRALLNTFLSILFAVCVGPSAASKNGFDLHESLVPANEIMRGGPPQDQDQALCRWR